MRKILKHNIYVTRGIINPKSLEPVLSLWFLSIVLLIVSLSFTHVSVSGGSLCTREGVWYYDEVLHTVLLGADDSLLHHEVGGGLALLVLALARKHALWHGVLLAVGVAADQAGLDNPHLCWSAVG